MEEPAVRLPADGLTDAMRNFGMTASGFAGFCVFGIFVVMHATPHVRCFGHCASPCSCFSLGSMLVLAMRYNFQTLLCIHEIDKN